MINFKKSQDAHRRLHYKYNFSRGKEYLKNFYHDRVYFEQNRLKRVLTKKEKQEVYNFVLKNFGKLCK